MLHVEIEGEPVVFCNLCAPNNDEPEFFFEIAEQMDRLQVQNRVTAGDFNGVLDPNINRFNSVETHKNSMDMLHCYILLSKMLNSATYGMKGTCRIDNTPGLDILQIPQSVEQITS